VGVTSHTNAKPVRRFAVYRNNVVVGLVDALAARFPATQRLVGEEFFRAMTHLFATRHPPRSPLLMTYGDALPDFIAAFPPAQELPYLADVARIEAARTRAYHAADAAPLAPAGLASLNPASLPALCLVLHPSVEIVRSPHPAVTIWAMNAGERPLGPIEDWRAEDALVARPALDVEVRALPPGGALFVNTLLACRPLGDAAATVAAETAAFDLTANLAVLIGAGLVIAIGEGKDPS
jgi:hypothetical protein